MWTGVVVAYIFTFIPEWTTWILLVAMSLYDICAVLTPYGPLQMLVNMAIERQQDIPALVYEARAAAPRPRREQPVSAATSLGEGREHARVLEMSSFAVAEGNETRGPNPSTTELEFRESPRFLPPLSALVRTRSGWYMKLSLFQSPINASWHLLTGAFT